MRRKLFPYTSPEKNNEGELLFSMLELKRLEESCSYAKVILLIDVFLITFNYINECITKSLNVEKFSNYIPINVFEADESSGS